MRIDIVNDLKSDYRKQRFHNALKVANVAELFNALEDKTLNLVARIIIQATIKKQNPLIPSAWAVYDRNGSYLYVTIVRPALSEAYCAVALYSEEDLKRVGVL